ncbi:MAG: response regulator [Oscillospiraceae bacterium]|jgi:PAS domain S-box-containing protein|nr:response regulator [Oscillospiraceae bacterium]
MPETVINLIVHLTVPLSVGMLVFVARKYRRSQIRSIFLAMFSLATLWNTGTMLELDVRALTGVTDMFLINICYIGICLLPVTVLHLGKCLLHPEWKPVPRHAALLIIPVISIAVVFTDSLHHMFFVNFSLKSSEAVYGWYYYFHSFYSYGCIAVGIVFMAVASARGAGLFSKQSLLILAAVLITLVPNMLYSFGVGDLPFSVSAAAFTFSIVCFAVAFVKYRFIASLPITLRRVVDLISDGYLLVDSQHYIISHNKALLRIFGEQSAALPGKPLRAFVERSFSDMTYEGFSALLAEAFARRDTVSAEALAAGGNFVSAEITPVTRRNAHIGSICVIRDITHSKQLMDAMQAANNAKSSFISNMSHEMRTPMNAIIGMAEIGKNTNDAGRKDYALDQIANASKHLLGIINDVLDMSKIEAGKLELVDVEFSFEQTVFRVADIVRLRMDEMNQKLIVSIDKAIPPVLTGDDQRLSQVITNLLSNACKFTPAGGSIALEAALVSEEGEKCVLRVTVSDNGIGISPEQQARLFRSFQQAEAGTTRKYGGTGLGLAISKTLVELMGGQIGVTSAPGEGSSFSFTFETRRGKGGDIARAARGGDSKGIFKGRKILLAEDIDINREIILSIIEPTLLSADCAENGLQAVQMYKRAPEDYDLILMDVQMPVMGGYEATAALRACGCLGAESVPIIAMTANVFKEDIDRCIESGMNGHIGKPIDSALLLDTLRKYLTRENMQ